MHLRNIYTGADKWCIIKFNKKSKWSFSTYQVDHNQIIEKNATERLAASAYEIP